jgi:hypothetical protein
MRTYELNAEERRYVSLCLALGAASIAGEVQETLNLIHELRGFRDTLNITEGSRLWNFGTELKVNT